MSDNGHPLSLSEGLKAAEAERQEARGIVRQRLGNLRAMVKGAAHAARQRLDSVTNPFTGLGDPDIDKGSAATVRLSLPLTLAECRALYRNNGIAARWIDSIADKGTASGWRVAIKGDEDEDTDEGEGRRSDQGAEPVDLDPLEQFDSDHDVMPKIADAWRWARRDGTAYIMIVTDEEQTNEVLSKPLSPGSYTISRLHVFTCDELVPMEWVDDMRDEDYRAASMYAFSPSVGGSGAMVHASRVVAIDGTKLDHYEKHINGRQTADSVLQKVWDQVRNLTTTMQAGANLAQELQLHVVKVDMPGMVEAHDRTLAFDERMRILAKSKSSVGAVLLSDGEEYQVNSANLTGFKEFMAAHKDGLAAVTGLPQTELFGEAPGGLNTDGESQRMTVNDLIATCQRHFIERPLTKLYRAAFNQAGEVEPESWCIEFAPAKKTSRTEEAGIRKTQAETDTLYVNAGVLTPEHVAESRFGEAGYQDDIAPVDMEELENSARAELEAVRAELNAARMQPPPGQQPPNGADMPPGQQTPEDEDMDET